MKCEEVFHRDPDILGGTPVFMGTRVPVDSLIQHLKHGKRIDELLNDFPSVRREQAEAFLDIAEQELVGPDVRVLLEAFATGITARMS